MGMWYRKPVVAGGGILALAIAVAVGCKPEPSLSTSSDVPLPDDATLGQETWDVVFLSGERVGHIHTSVFRESGTTGDRLRIEQYEALTLRSNNNRIDTKTAIRSLETLDGQLLEFTSILPQGELPLKTDGHVEGNELHLEVGTVSEESMAVSGSGNSRQFDLETTGKKTKVTLPWAPDFGGPYRVAGSLQANPLAPGETRTLRYLDAATNQLSTTVLTASDYEETDLTAGSERLLRAEAKTTIGGHTINSILWTDEQGEVLKTQVPEMFNFTAIRATKEEALQKVTQIDFDLGKKSAVHVERTLPAPHHTKRVVYRIQLEASDPTQVFDTGLTQQVVAEDDHTAQITVYGIRPGDATGNPQVQPEGVAEGDLEPNNLIQSDDPTVVFLAQQAAGKIDDPWQSAMALERLVHTKMTSLGISSAFATAGEVARDLKGDCTEHAVLLAALARSRGIPARVAIGLVYYRQEFLYHMWTEVHVDGAWIPLDATLGQGGIGAAHLKISDSNLEGASPNAAFLPVTEVIGQLKIEILEVE
jgi:Transglutaminase-like superfamily